jgi:hypothetical protein
MTITNDEQVNAYQMISGGRAYVKICAYLICFIHLRRMSTSSAIVPQDICLDYV